MAKKCVLIIEDDVGLQTLLRKRLRFQGFDTVSVFAVEDALKQIQNWRPSLILLDLGFKKTDGTAFLLHMKKWLLSETFPPPILVISGHNDKEIVDFCMRFGAKGFIAKPFVPEKLIQTVLDYI